MYPRETLEAFDALLSGRGLRLGADVLQAAKDFAKEARRRGGVLSDEWLNNGPAMLASDLPEGWQARLQLVFHGNAIERHTLGRSDLLKAKVFALCDRGFDLPDCIALRPTAKELADLVPWLEVRDLHPGWPAHVRETVADLGRRLDHGV